MFIYVCSGTTPGQASRERTVTRAKQIMNGVPGFVFI